MVDPFDTKEKYLEYRHILYQLQDKHITLNDLPTQVLNYMSGYPNLMTARDCPIFDSKTAQEVESILAERILLGTYGCR